MAFHLQRPWLRTQWRSGSVILITGAGSGIGRAIALKYAERSCTLILVARTASSLEAVAEECRRVGPACAAEVFPIDVSNESECARLMTHVAEKFGALDILVLCAGIGAHQYFQTTTDLSVYRRLMDVNFFGYLYCTKYAMELLKSRHGQIVVVSSISGEIGLPMRTAYCASKFAVTGFFESLRTELKRENTMLMPSACDVDITIVCPPTVDTNLRKNALANVGGAPSPGQGSGKKKMSAAACATCVVDAADHRMRKIYFPMKAYAAVYLRPFLPDLVDAMVSRDDDAAKSAAHDDAAADGRSVSADAAFRGAASDPRSFGDKLRAWFGVDVDGSRRGGRSRL